MVGGRQWVAGCEVFRCSEEPFLQYWHLMKEVNNIRELEEVSIRLQGVCSSTHIPTSSWVEGLFKHSEMLILKGDSQWYV
jgi:hypothetical protein